MQHRQLTGKFGFGVLLCFCFMTMGVGCASTTGGSVHKEDEFKPIFNGKDLTDWVIWYPGRKNIKPDAYYVDEEGSLVCKGYNAYWIRYDKPLSDIVLRLQFKIAEDTNSGVVLRAEPTGHPPFTGFEVQIFHDVGGDPHKHSTGAIYDIVTPMYENQRPVGEWNDLEIINDGLYVKVTLNGRVVIDTTFAQLTEPIGKFDFAYADMKPTGYLCLQDHGSKVWFRDIRVKKLR